MVIEGAMLSTVVDVSRGSIAVALASASVLWCAAWASALFVEGLWVLALPSTVGVAFSAVAWCGLHAVCQGRTALGKRVSNAAASALLAVALLGFLYGGAYLVPALLMLIASARFVPHGRVGSAS
jgi:hypothetical protein